MYESCMNKKHEKMDRKIQDIDNMIEMTDTEEVKNFLKAKKVIMLRMKFDKCLIPQFKKKCGFNSKTYTILVKHNSINIFFFF